VIRKETLIPFIGVLIFFAFVSWFVYGHWVELHCISYGHNHRSPNNELIPATEEEKKRFGLSETATISLSLHYQDQCQRALWFNVFNQSPSATFTSLKAYLLDN